MKLKWLKDKLGEKFYPIAHATGVVIGDNKTLDSKLAEIDKSLTEINEDIKRNGYGETAGGKNLLKPTGFNTTTYVGGAACTQNEDGSVTIKGTVTSAWHKLIIGRCKLEAGNYTFSSKYSAASGLIFIETPTEDALSAEHFSFTITKSTNFYIRLSLNVGEYDCTIYPQIEQGLTDTDYEPWYPSNKILSEETAQQSTELNNQRNEAYLKKNLVNYKSLFSDLSDNADGTSHSYSDGELMITRTSNIYSGVYVYSAQITPLQGKNLIVSFDAKATVTGMKLNIYLCEGGTPSVTDAITSDYKRYRLKIKAGSSQNNLIIYGNDVAGDVYIKNFMITEDYVTDTEYVDYVKSNMELDTYKADKSETTVNLLNPTLETTTVNGITVTNNGDGTYSLNGTASGDTAITTQVIKPDKSKKYKLTGCPKGGSDSTYDLTMVSPENNYSDFRHDYGNGTIVDNLQFENYQVNIGIVSGTTLNNLVFKPMITTNLDAVYDDFVPYTGDTGKLNSDVADLRGDVDGFGDELVTRRIQLLANHTADYYRYIEPIRGRDQILIPPVIVNGSSESFDESGDVDSVSFANYSYAKRNSVKMDILDVEVSSSITQAGVTVKYIDKRIDSYKYYNVKGTATSDIEIPLYSVTNPKNNNYLYFVTDSVSKMSSDTFYIKIADDSGNETTLGSDGSKDVKTNLKPSGKVIVYFVIKSGIKVNRYVNVKCGYSSSYCVADFSASKYSDTIDNVLDAILDLNSRLKALENK